MLVWPKCARGALCALRAGGVAFVLALGLIGERTGPRALYAGQGLSARSGGRVRLFWDFHGLTQTGRPPTLEASHPDLEGVFVAVRWADIEPEQGAFDFTSLDAEIDWWANRGIEVVIRNGLLGTVGSGSHVPQWIYDLGVPDLQFQPSPASEELLTLPAVWDSPLFLDVYEDYVMALAQRYDGDPRVSFVSMGLGHLGLSVADPTAGGASALPQAGWTPQAWAAYIADVTDIHAGHFVETPTLLGASPLWTRRHQGQAIAAQMQGVATYAATTGASLLLKGLDPQQEEWDATPFPAMLDALDQTALPAGFTVFMGDDWPLWVDEGRRANHPRESERDQAGFAAALQIALAEWDRLGRRCDLALVLLKPEMIATNPNHPQYQPEVGAILQEFLASGSGGPDAWEASPWAASR